jgi:anti-sigma regulatory factor (Ser/Thr protein kinase)
MPQSATVRLELDSRPECLTLVRAMLAGVAESLAFDSELLDDLKTAVSEACNNVVLHAYGGEPGPLLVELMVSEVYVEVMVRDLGSGIQYVASDDRMGVGLAVISALAARAEFLSVPGGGTEVRMSFSRAGPDRQGLGRAVESEPGEEPPIRLSGDVVLTVTPVSLLTGSLGRLARAVAAGARFSLDRFSDVYLVTDAIAAHAERAASGAAVSFAIIAANRRLELVIGPFQAGSAAALRADAAADRPVSPLALLADELTVEQAENSELLRVLLVDRRDGSDGSEGADG